MKKVIPIIFGAGLLLLAISLFRFWPQPAPVGTPAQVKVARCVGYCNLPLFVAADIPSDEIKVQLQYIPNPGDHGRALVAPNGPIASVTPFTNMIVARGNALRVKIIAGSGMNGLAIVARPEIKSLEDLKGKKIATFRGDTLEAFAYAALKDKHLQDEVTFAYFADALEPLTALRNGEVQAVTHVEPFVTQLVNKDHMTLLLRGESFWKTDIPDCVLVSTEAHIEKHRKDLKVLILQMAKAQFRIEQSLEQVASEVAQPFYNMSADDLVFAVKAQFPAIDIRGKADFVIGQGQSLLALGYIDRAPTESDLFDFSLLNEVIKEHPEVFDKLAHRYPE